MGAYGEDDKDDDQDSPYPKYISLPDTLPPNIKCLELNGCLDDSVKYLIKLGQDLGRFPKLKVLQLGTSADYVQLLEESGLRQLCDEAGVELKIQGPSEGSDDDDADDNMEEESEDEE